VTFEELAQLKKFYGVEDMDDLVVAQAKHIERLQAMLPPLRDEFPRTPRA
jgi:hypothetical protein